MVCAAIKIKNLFKGEVNKNKSLNILETGGEYEAKNHVFEENEVLKQNQEAIVYLKKYRGPVAEDAYVIIGVNYGKFKLGSNGEIIQDQKGSLAKIKDVNELKLKEIQYGQCFVSK